jgi:hypothetical protein
VELLTRRGPPCRCDVTKTGTVVSLRFVDPLRLRVVRTVALGRGGGLESIAWLVRDRVLVLGTDQLYVVDSATGQVIDRTATRR